jgi:hypothetical protein
VGIHDFPGAVTRGAMEVMRDAFTHAGFVTVERAYHFGN